MQRQTWVEGLLILPFDLILFSSPGFLKVVLTLSPPKIQSLFIAPLSRGIIALEKAE